MKVLMVRISTVLMCHHGLVHIKPKDSELFDRQISMKLKTLKHHELSNSLRRSSIRILRISSGLAFPKTPLPSAFLAS